MKGKSADGTWRTAAKKLYPSPLCRVLATAITDALQIDPAPDLGESDKDELQEDLEGMFKDMVRCIDSLD